MYGCFPTIRLALFYSRVDYESKMFQTAKKSHLWNHLSKKDLPYIFINGRISVFQGNFQAKSNLHISSCRNCFEKTPVCIGWPCSLNLNWSPKYVFQLDFWSLFMTRTKKLISQNICTTMYVMVFWVLEKSKEQMIDFIK